MEKFKDKKKIIKANVVACDYEEDSHYLKTDSPTCSCEAMHIIMLMALVRKWQVESLDSISVFLWGDELERKIFLRPPSEICPESLVWTLKRCIYRLNVAPYSLYKRVNHKLTNLKRIVSAYGMMQLVT